MEGFLLQLGGQLLPAIGIILIGLATWGIAILKQKTSSEIARSALGQVDQIVGVVVGKISQTAADALKSAAADGKLTDSQKSALKNVALVEIHSLLTHEVSAAAAKTVTDLQLYISQKIEERVLAQEKKINSVVLGQGEKLAAVMEKQHGVQLEIANLRSDMLLCYVRREDFIREIVTIKTKLDRLRDLLAAAKKKEEES